MLNLIQQNQSFIDQAISLILKMQPAAYSQCSEEVFSSSIGQHVRHCIEHYDELLVAHAEKRVVRYHARPRNVEVETDSEVAVNRLRFIHNQLDRVGGIATPSPSSLSRELEFLISHTVHHFALITVIANKFQIEVPENFGIAPTTLKHRESN
jgi:hypothetical protein